MYDIQKERANIVASVGCVRAHVWTAKDDTDIILYLKSNPMIPNYKEYQINQYQNTVMDFSSFVRWGWGAYANHNVGSVLL